MKKNAEKNEVHLEPLTALEFLESYNQNMPPDYPQVTMEMMDKFRTSHANLFKDKNTWTLDSHRKRMIEWLRYHQ